MWSQPLRAFVVFFPVDGCTLVRTMPFTVMGQPYHSLVVRYESVSSVLKTSSIPTDNLLNLLGPLFSLVRCPFESILSSQFVMERQEYSWAPWESPTTRSRKRGSRHTHSISSLSVDVFHPHWFWFYIKLTARDGVLTSVCRGI
jgi:hypothetical protein